MHRSISDSDINQSHSSSIFITDNMSNCVYSHSNHDILLHKEQDNSVEKCQYTQNYEAYCNNSSEVFGTQNADYDKATITENSQDMDVNMQGANDVCCKNKHKRQDAERKKRQRELQSTEQKQRRLEKMKMWRRQQSTTEKEVDAQRKKIKRGQETVEQKQLRLEKMKMQRRQKSAALKQVDAEQKKIKRSKQTAEQKQLRLEKRKKEREELESTQTAKEKFQSAMKAGPTYACTVCHRLMYKCSVHHIRADSLEKRYKKTPRHIVTGAFECTDKCNFHVCHTCDGALRCGRIPAQSKINGLQLDAVPEVLKDLTPLERQLISTRIPFMKLLCLPRGRQYALHGPVVNVPAKFKKICTLLPRIPKSACLLRVKLKRQLRYKGHCMYQMVRPEVIKKALKWLRVNNVLYKDVTLNDKWQEEWTEHDKDLWEAMTTSLEESTGLYTENTPNTETEIAKSRDQNVTDVEPDDDDDEQTMYQHGQSQQPNNQQCEPTSTADNDQEDQAALDRHTTTHGNPLDSCFHINNIESKTISIAPAEGETPLPIFLDDVFEEGCNPDKYPYGTGGLGANRKTKLTAKKFFNQRILHADGRFARDVQYLHIAQYAVESKSIQDQIRIAFRKIKGRKINGKQITAGLLKNNDQVNQLIHSDQAFKFMRNVRGSPPYWQRVFYDVLAMVRQLGCPTWFISLSAADLHWPELIKLIAGERGRTLTDEDVKLLSWDEKCQILRENPVTAARQFNYRVDKFFSLFLKSSSHPVGKITEYFIRIEFQARGSPHAHALLWVENAPQIDVQTDEDVCQFIDKYITCSAKSTQPDVQQEVPLQQHRHSSACR